MNDINNLINSGSIKELYEMSYISGFVWGDADNIGVQPTVGQLELFRIVGGNAERADCQDSLVFAFPCRVLRDQKALQLNVLMYFSRCSHYLSLRGTLYLEMMKTKNNNKVFSVIRSISLLFLKLSIRKLFQLSTSNYICCINNFGNFSKNMY